MFTTADARVRVLSLRYVRLASYQDAGMTLYSISPETYIKTIMATDNTHPTAAHKLLAALKGHWRTQGQTVATKGSPSIPIDGTDTYEWLPGGFFMIHHVDVRMGQDEAKTLEVIGYDVATNTYPTTFFDNQGNTGSYRATINNGVWTFQGAADRATLTIGDRGNTMHAHWERSDDGSPWQDWMLVTLTRLS
jgi:hypothetical protein